MNKIILRLQQIKSGEVIEVVFDTRLNFTENFTLLRDIYALETVKMIYDGQNNLALRKDVPLKEFNFSNFYLLDIY